MILLHIYTDQQMLGIRDASKALEQANRPRRFKVSDGGARKEHTDRPQCCDVCWQIEGVVEIKCEGPDGKVRISAL